jgi:hypothetical protein
LDARALCLQVQAHRQEPGECLSVDLTALAAIIHSICFG